MRWPGRARHFAVGVRLRLQSATRLRAAADFSRANKERYATLMTAEMGKPIVESEAEIEKCAWNCEYYAENGERFLAKEEIATNAHHSYIQFDPLGVVLAVMPWNFPFWQVFRFAAPALMGEQRAAKARIERAGVSPRHRGSVPRERLPRWRLSHPAGTRLYGPGAYRRPAYTSCNAHRE